MPIICFQARIRCDQKGCADETVLETGKPDGSTATFFGLLKQVMSAGWAIEGGTPGGVGGISYYCPRHAPAAEFVRAAKQPRPLAPAERLQGEEN